MAKSTAQPSNAWLRAKWSNDDPQDSGFVKRLAREPEFANRDINGLFAEASALGMMVDGFLRSVYVEKESATAVYVRAVAPDAVSLALFLTQLWVRAIYCRDMRWSPARSSDSR